jgi:ubiquinone biosynthesis protein
MALLGEIRHELVRVRQIARMLQKHGFAPTMRRMPLLRRFAKDDAAAAADPAPQRVCRLLEDLGPTFVKLGQILSTRTDLLPAEFTSELSRLQDQVPPFAFELVRRQVESGLGQPLEELFGSFAEQPLASASMAQVHTATLRDGQSVVVKVQRPGIAAEVRADASILVLLAQLLEMVVEEFSTYHVSDLAQEFEAGLTAELDFSLEAQNLQAFASCNQGREGVHVPRFYAALSGRTVLTMERIHGRRITELEHDVPRTRAIVERLVLLNFEHIFVDGMFHADPHPGNVLVDDVGNFGFIDFGLMGRLARDTQDRMLVLLLAVTLRDADTLARVLVRLGDAPSRVHLYSFRDAISRVLDRYLGLGVAQIDTSAVLEDLVELSARFGMRMPRELALLSKTTMTIDGIVRTLHPTFEPSTLLAERAQGLLIERLDPRRLQGGGLRMALQLGMLVQELPMQISQTLLDLERGHLQVSMVSSDLALLDRNLRGLGMTIFGGLLASASVLGGFYALARQDVELVGVPVVPAAAFLVAGGIFGVAFTWFLTGGRMKKISAARLIAGVLGKRRAGTP